MLPQNVTLRLHRRLPCQGLRQIHNRSHRYDRIPCRKPQRTVVGKFIVHSLEKLEGPRPNCRGDILIIVRVRGRIGGRRRILPIIYEAIAIAEQELLDRVKPADRPCARLQFTQQPSQDPNRVL